MHAFMHKAARICLSLCMVLQLIPSNQAQAKPLSRSEYKACQAQNETQFKTAIRAITIAALRKGTANLDYQALVGDQWRAHKLDNVIDAQVDVAMAQVRSETSWGQLLQSLAYRDKAKELAVAMAERVYRSDEIKKSIENMAIDAGREIGQSIELTASDAQRPAEACLRAFLGPRYGETVATAVVEDTAAAFVVPPDQATASSSGSAIAANASGAIAGAVILLVRRQLSRMAQRLGQRVVGAVLGRLVAVVAGGIGVVLIAKDVWDLRYGVLPIVAEEMKSQATKAKVKDELARVIEEQIASQLEELADRASTRIIDIWREFRLAHLKVLQLAKTNAQFKNFIETARPDQLARVDEIVAIALRQGNEGTIDRMMQSGTLQRAVVQLPDAGLQIARETQSIDLALSWWDLAGEQLSDVVKFSLYKKTQPDAFTLAQLKRLLNLKDATVIARLAEVSPQSREVLMNIGDDRIVPIAREMQPDQLAILAGYMTALGAPARQEIIATIAAAPDRIGVLTPGYVQQGLQHSNDQLAAVKMMFRMDRGLDINVIRSDFHLVWQRQVSPLLMWSKHPVAIVAIGLLFLFLLLVMRRVLLMPGRRTALKTS